MDNIATGVGAATPRFFKKITANTCISERLLVLLLNNSIHYERTHVPTATD
jgi:hypothetical protein